VAKRPALTQANAVVGTPDFMAPEQATDPRRADIRADIYSLGCTLYYLLTARLPFPDGTPLEKLIARQVQPPPSMSSIRADVPAHFLPVLDKLLATDPARRYQAPREVVDALAPFAAGRQPNRTRSLALLALSAAALLALAVVLWPDPAKHDVPGAKKNSAADEQVALPPSPHELQVLRDKDGFRGAAFSRDGKWAASTGLDDSIQLWNLATGKAETRIPGDHALGTLCIAPGNERIAGGGADGFIGVWDLPAGKLFRKLEGPRGRGGASAGAAFALDQLHLLTAGSDHNIVMWKVAENRIMQTYQGHEGAITSLSIGAGNRFAVSSSLDGTVRVWDLQEGKEGFRLSHHVPTWSAALSNNSYFVLTGCADHSVRLWRLTTQRELRRFQGHSGKVVAVALDSDNRLALSGSSDGTVRLWELASGKELARYEGHAAEILCVGFHPDRKRALSAGKDGSLRFWQLPATSTEPTRYSERINVVAIDAPGQRTLMARGDERIEVLEKPANSVLQGHTDAVTALDLAKDGRLAVSGGWDESVRVWHFDKPAQAGLRTPVHTFFGHTGKITSVALSADGKLAASGGADGSIHLWNLAVGEKLNSFPAHQGSVWGLRFSPAGEILISGGDDGNVILWYVNTASPGRVPASFVQRGAHNGRVSSISFAPDGRHFASGGNDGLVKLWKLTQRGFQTAEIHELREHTGAVRAVEFHPDGRLLASAGADRTILIWDTYLGKCADTLRGHADEIDSLSFNGEGSTLVAGSLDGQTKFWSIKFTPPEPPEPKPPANTVVTPLTFTGNAHVEIENSKSLIRFDKPFTAEMWVYISKNNPGFFLCGDFHAAPTDLSGWCIAGQASTHRDQDVIVLFAKFGFRRLTSSGGLEQFEVFPERWHHVALVMDGETGRLFVDGRVLRELSPKARSSSPDAIYLGSKPDSDTQRFNGKIRAFRLSSTARYQGVFTPPQLFNKDRHTEVLLDFCGKGERVPDLSGHDRSGRIVGARWDKPFKLPQ
ncbi:MAG: LamG-like jellyroll fold domain-containing protein, partial [Gemmataceae bacterium]